MSPSKPKQAATHRKRETNASPPTVSGRWILTALGITLPAALFCTWAVFCLFFWQGSWQLLYHPTSPITRTPASAGMNFDQVSFATTEDGTAQLQGWWIPAAAAHYTVLYLHDEKGNLSDAVEALKAIHEDGLNVLAFDYRGYGPSRFEHPTEARWRQDADWALGYLTGTRHIDPHTILVIGKGLGADLALQVAAAHPELAGVVVEQPIEAPVNAIFDDPRAKLVPAHLLVRDRYDLGGPAERLRIPSLWLTSQQQTISGPLSNVFEKVAVPKSRDEMPRDGDISAVLKKWVGSLNKDAAPTAPHP